MPLGLIHEVSKDYGFYGSVEAAQIFPKHKAIPQLSICLIFSPIHSEYSLVGVCRRSLISWSHTGTDTLYKVFEIFPKNKQSQSLGFKQKLVKLTEKGKRIRTGHPIKMYLSGINYPY